MAAEGEFPKVDGDILFASEANLLNPIHELYTGSDYDSSGGAGTNEQSHELNAVDSSLSKSASYVRITFIGDSTSAVGAGESIVNSVKAQIKETSDSYADIISYVEIFRKEGFDAGEQRGSSITIIGTLTSGMKSNGFQIKAFSKVVGSGTVTGSYSNVQTVVELL